jgi:hypothetical protein
MAFSRSIDYFGIFGDGGILPDGTVNDATWTSSSPVTLTADSEYNNLTISSGTHYTDGFMLRVAGTLTLNGGKLSDEGNPGTDGQTVAGNVNLSTLTAGGAGDAGTGWLRRVKYGGGSGGAAKTTADSSSNGTEGDGGAADGNYAPTIYIATCGGGAGGNSDYGGSTYGQGGDEVNPLIPVATVNSLFLAAIARQRNTDDTENFCSLGCGSGGGGGGGYPRNGTAVETKGSGGGGGGGGGLIWIAARRIVVNGSFEISVKGGDGGDGQNKTHPVSPVGFPGGGGGGGGGGAIIIIAEQAIGWSVSAGKPTLNVSGGSGGTATAVGGSSPGSDGESGVSYVYILS